MGGINESITLNYAFGFFFGKNIVRCFCPEKWLHLNVTIIYTFLHVFLTSRNDSDVWLCLNSPYIWSSGLLVFAKMYYKWITRSTFPFILFKQEQERCLEIFLIHCLHVNLPQLVRLSKVPTPLNPKKHSLTFIWKKKLRIRLHEIIVLLSSTMLQSQLVHAMWKKSRVLKLLFMSSQICGY